MYVTLGHVWDSETFLGLGDMYGTLRNVWDSETCMGLGDMYGTQISPLALHRNYN